MKFFAGLIQTRPLQLQVSCESLKIKIGLLLKPFSFRELPQMAVVASIHGTPQSDRKTGPVRVFSGLVVFQQALICRAFLNFPLGSSLLDYTDSALTINTEPRLFVWRLRDPSRSQLMSLRSCPVCPTEHSELKRPRLKKQWTEQ